MKNTIFIIFIFLFSINIGNSQTQTFFNFYDLDGYMETSKRGITKYDETGDIYTVDKYGSDISIRKYDSTGNFLIDPSYGYYSFNYADVNTSGGITALDALMANYRAVGLLPNYYHSGANLYNRNFEVTGRFVDDQYHDTSAAMPMYVDVPFTHSGEDYLYYDSAVPTTGGFKAEPSISLVLDDQFAANIEDELNVPIFIDRKASLGAITLDMNYRNDLIEVIGVNYGEDFHYINHEEGVVLIGWFSTETMNVNAGQAIASIKVRVLSDIEPGTELFELNTNTELADGFANVIGGVTLKTKGVTTDKSAVLASDLKPNFGFILLLFLYLFLSLILYLIIKIEILKN